MRIRDLMAAGAVVLAAAGLASGRPAQAAGERPAGRRVCVVALNNISGIGGPELGQRAAARLEAALAGVRGWALVPSAPGGPPAAADSSDRARLAGAAWADLVVYGTVTSARFSGTQAMVRMLVAVADARTGALVETASVQGAADASGLPDSAQALEQAAAGAAQAFADRLSGTTGGPVRAIPGVAASGCGPTGGPTGARVVASAREAPKVSARQLTVQPPPPVVVDVPESAFRRSHRLISQQTWRNLVGGFLLTILF